MRAILRIEVEAVRFLKEEPHKLDSLLKRVRSMTDILTMLRRWIFFFFFFKTKEFPQAGLEQLLGLASPLLPRQFWEMQLAVFYTFFLEPSQGKSNWLFLCSLQFCSDQQPSSLDPVIETSSLWTPHFQIWEVPGWESLQTGISPISELINSRHLQQSKIIEIFCDTETCIPKNVTVRNKTGKGSKWIKIS